MCGLHGWNVEVRDVNRLVSPRSNYLTRSLLFGRGRIANKPESVRYRGMGSLDITTVPAQPTPPEDGFKLFISGEPWQMNAVLNFGMGATGYAEGYLQAAEALMDQLENGRGLPDLLVYPIVFLYRQHLELQLKDIIWHLKQAGYYKRVVPGGHDVLQLWKESKSPLEEYCGWGKDEAENLKRVEEYLRQFSEIDAHSDAFRYHVNKKGAPSLPDVKHINLLLFRAHLKWLIDWLAGVTAWIYHLRDLQQEADSAGY